GWKRRRRRGRIIPTTGTSHWPAHWAISTSGMAAIGAPGTLAWSPGSAGSRRQYRLLPNRGRGIEGTTRMANFDPQAAAAFVAEAHRTRAPYRNLPPEIAPPTITDAYAAQDALKELWTPIHGPVRGLKIATTTK